MLKCKIFSRSLSLFFVNIYIYLKERLPKKSSKLYLITAFSVITFIFQVPLFANGFNVNSIGSRAAGMGGAYIGLADDYSAIFWNPAGLIQLRNKTLGLYLTDVIPFRTWNWNNPDPFYPDVYAEAKIAHYFSGLISYYHPLNKNLIAGIAFYVPSDLGTEWNGLELKDRYKEYGEWKSRIKVTAISPVFALRISNILSIGISLNVYYGTFNLKRIVHYKQYSESSSGYGVGLTTGVLFTPADEIFSIGITFKAGYRMGFEGEAERSFSPEYPDIPSRSALSRDVLWPMCIGWGIAVKPLDNVIITADFQWTNWSVMDVIEADYKDPGWQKEMIYYRHDTDIEFFWDHALQIRFGSEYKLKKNIALRGGFYYDHSPASNIRFNFLLPSLTHLGFTLGIGCQAGNLHYDFGLEYLVGLKQKIDPSGREPGIHAGAILVPNFSVTYKF